MRTELQQVIDQHKLPINLCGLRDDLDAILPHYDMFVMSSFYEGQPLSLLEAVAAGLPALLSDIPVLREVLGDDALYFDISDPGSFEKKIHEILANKNLLPKLAAAGRKRIGSFAGKQYYMGKLRALYDAV
jgi:glycosyltransferase involved in cell wall biosynthesis